LGYREGHDTVSSLLHRRKNAVSETRYSGWDYQFGPSVALHLFDVGTWLEQERQGSGGVYKRKEKRIDLLNVVSRTLTNLKSMS
jgi:hypothetical protein